MSLAERERKTKGVIFGRSLNHRPEPVAGESVASPLRLTDVEYFTLPQKSWRDQVRLFLQASGLSTIPMMTRLRWQAHDTIEWLQASLLGKGRAKRVAITHPVQLLPAMEFLMGLPPDLDVERRMIQTLVGRALIDYRKRISQEREKPLLFAREASNYFYAGFKDQQLISKVSAPSEQFFVVQRIYNNYYYFRLFYICSIISREPAEGANKLFSKFMRSSFFLSTVQDDGTLAAKPSYRSLPPKDHVVYLAKRDNALQARLREDSGLRTELQSVLRYFRPLRG
ncbi:hypothetical protein [Nitrospirillum amazonense]|uniref:Uncharacterized protein n=1 Tax=Nitrospirillum amazonense TaxID=28077 RepID=A0A560KH05_9PROT|nr:hypothetical protein [Nitrospirillum amazonense]MDG3443277.1 hypothetical protein [Nitrospirillum amazonense]TWB82583.1 hypothetical protein FBZ87_101291 [Nitrospirillum amazonense]